MKIVITLFTIITIILVATLAIQIYSSYQYDNSEYELSLDLQRLKLQKEIEEVKIQQEVERRETSVIKAKLDRQIRLESHRHIEAAAIISAVFWRIMPMFISIFALSAVSIWYLNRPLSFEFQSVRAMLPRRAIISMTQEALLIQRQAEMAKALAFAEEVSQARLKTDADVIKGLRSAAQGTVHEMPALPEQIVNHNIPTFAEVLGNGSVQHGRLLLGYAAGEPISKLWEECYSMAFAGQSGSGKTSTLRNFISQAALSNYKIIVLDGHTGADESLTVSLRDLVSLPNVKAYQRFELKRALIDTLHQIETQITSGEKAKPLTLIVMDELKNLLRIAPIETRVILEKVGMETRKYGIYGLFAAHSWPADMLNGSEVRDNLVMMLSHKTKKQQARMLYDSIEEAKKVSRLRKGQILATGNYIDEPMTIDVPYCSPEDMSTVYQLAAAHDLNGNRDTQQIASEAGVQSMADIGLTDKSIQSGTLTPDVVKSYINRRRQEAPTFSQNKLAKLANVNKSRLSQYNRCKLELNEDELNRLRVVILSSERGECSNVVDLNQYSKRL